MDLEYGASVKSTGVQKLVTVNSRIKTLIDKLNSLFEKTNGYRIWVRESGNGQLYEIRNMLFRKYSLQYYIYPMIDFNTHYHFQAELNELPSKQILFKNHFEVVQTQRLRSKQHKILNEFYDWEVGKVNVEKALASPEARASVDYIEEFMDYEEGKMPLAEPVNYNIHKDVPLDLFNVLMKVLELQQVEPGGDEGGFSAKLIGWNVTGSGYVFHNSQKTSC